MSRGSRAFGLPAEAVHAARDVGREAGARLFAVADDVDTCVDLLADHAVDARLDLTVELRLVDRLS